MTTGKASELVARDRERAEIRRQWGLLHSADLFVVELHRSDLGYAVVIESALERRAHGDSETIAGAIVAARTALGYEEQGGRLVLLGRTAA